jgi:hypothetical protein
MATGSIPLQPIVSHDRTCSRNTLPVCLRSENPHRLVSLLDIVNTFNAADLCFITGKLAAFYGRASRLRMEGQSQRVPDDIYAMLHELFADAEKFSVRVGFGSTREIARTARRHLEQSKNYFDTSNVVSEVRHVERSLQRDAGSRKFIRIVPSLSKFVDNDALFGDQVHRAFPSARFDIKESGNCLAVGCDTAAVFHLMRAVEWGLRALCVNLGFRRLRSRSKKTGKVSYTPVPWSDWEGILTQVKSRVTERIAKLKRGPRKQIYQEFYYPALQDIEGVKDAFRNDVMHTRREYTGPEAIAILDRVQRIMQNLCNSPIRKIGGIIKT